MFNKFKFDYVKVVVVYWILQREMDSATQVQILSKAINILQSANALEEIIEQMGSITLIWQLI